MRLENRSLNGGLHEGQTDGSYRKAHPNRGGIVEPTTDKIRADLHPYWGYGFPTTEKHPKAAPDGTVVP